jgi:hypothetical protein
VVGCLRAWEEGERERRREGGRKGGRERVVEEVQARRSLSQHSNRRIVLNREEVVRGRKREWRRRVEMPGQGKRASLSPIASVQRDFRSRYTLPRYSRNSCNRWPRLAHVLLVLYSWLTGGLGVL